MNWLLFVGWNVTTYVQGSRVNGKYGLSLVITVPVSICLEGLSPQAGLKGWILACLSSIVD